MFPVQDDGSLGEGSGVQRHAPSVDSQGRPTTPFAHSIIVDPAGRFALAADMGTDRIYVYRIDRQGKALVPNDPPFVDVAAGTGPRHLAFHPRGTVLFVINEKKLSITSFSFDGGRLESIETVPLIPQGRAPGNATAAEVAVHPNGRFVLVGNQGRGTITVFRMDPQGGELTSVGDPTPCPSPVCLRFAPGR